jgi:DNA polymerase III subunit alpha
MHIEKTLNSAGVHPAGMIICKNDIVDHVPLRESKGQVCSQFTGPEVEELGLLKYDLLAIKTLNVLDDTVNLIKERHGKVIDIDALEPDDPKVFALFNGGYRNMDNRGIFQFEAYGISKMVKNIRIDTFDDLIACNALYRPGPLGAGVPDLYADYKHGRKKIVYLHPKMGEILKSTYGCMVFQEDFMKVSQVLANFTKGQSDTLRKVVGKKKPELIKKEKLDEKFVAGCKINGIDEGISKEIFKQIEYFGGYGFNRSHSAAYSLLAYQCAWLKIYYPIEFMCSLLTSEIDNSDKGEKMGTYFKEAERMGIIIKEANINKSGLKFKIEKGISKTTGKELEFLRTPFTAIGGIGQVAAELIVANQEYKDLKDFLSRVNGSKITIKVFQSLVDTGCMDDCWKMRRTELTATYASVKDEISKEKANKKKQDEYIDKFGDESFLWLGGKNSDVKL